jgi:hypothetical protein
MRSARRIASNPAALPAPFGAVPFVPFVPFPTGEPPAAARSPLVVVLEKASLVLSSEAMLFRFSPVWKRFKTLAGVFSR